MMDEKKLAIYKAKLKSRTENNKIRNREIIRRRAEKNRLNKVKFTPPVPKVVVKPVSKVETIERNIVPVVEKINENTEFVFIIPSYNNESNYLKNLNSVLNQTYQNWRVVYVDDCSTDNTYDLVSKYIVEKNVDNKVKLLKTDKNRGPAYSRHEAFKECKDDEICCLLDGDDWLYDNNVLEKLNRLYVDNDLLVSYGGTYEYKNGKLNNREKTIVPFPEDVIKGKTFRQHQWSVYHLRTGKAELFKSIPEDYLKDEEGEWIKCCTDMAVMWWVLERCDGKFMVNNFPTYVYNIDNTNKYITSYYRRKEDKSWEMYREKVMKQLMEYKYKKYVISDDQIKLNKYLEDNKIEQICISKSLSRFDRIKKIYDLSDYNPNSNQPALFFGVYDLKELENISKYSGKKYVMFGGSDVDDRIEISEKVLSQFNTIKNYEVISISQDIQDRLNKYNIKSTLINLDLMIYELFKPRDMKGNKIYIYDGQGNITNEKNTVYGQKYIDEIMKKLPEYEYILSSKLNQIPYEKMADVYAECFIGLRLTDYDGNANTVKEFEAMGIPIVHNQSEYGLKWDNVDYIVKYILSIKNNKDIEIDKLKINNILNGEMIRCDLSKKCVIISECLSHFIEQYNNSHNPKKYNINEDCVFFGMYNEEDCINFINHKGKKYILWGGTDLRFVDSIKKYHKDIFNQNIYHIAISKFMFNKLILFTKNIYFINFNMILNNLSTFNEHNKKTHIYIYTSNDERRAKLIYGYDLYVQLIDYFINEKFMTVNNKSFKYDEMRNVYKNIKLGLRLTYFDGNANTVQELASNGIYSLNNSDVIGSIPYIEDVNLLKYQVKYLLNKLKIPDKKLYIRSQINNKLNIKNISHKKYNIYILYLYYPYLTDSIGGAAINEINKIACLINEYNVYYNDIYINDCFDKNLNYIHTIFIDKLKKHNNENINFITDRFNTKINNIFYPSRDYDICFYRGIGDNEICEKIFNILPEPKIWFQTYNKKIWNKNIIGFTTETCSILANIKYLQNYNSDGTMNYNSDMIVPKRDNFILYQSIREKSIILTKLNLKKKYKTEFIICIIGTIYNCTYPWSHMKIIEKLRSKYPKKNITILILSHTIINKLPNKDWIHIINVNKHLVSSYLNECDIVIDTWNNEQIIYGGANKLIDCINIGIPVITAKTFAHIELLGKEYKLFHTFQATEKFFNINIEKEIENKILYCFNKNNIYNIKEYLLSIKNKFNTDIVCQKYTMQINKIYEKNILIICPNLYIGGVTTYTMNMINALKNFNLFLCIENKTNLNQIIYENIKIYTTEINYDQLNNTDLYFNTIICNSSPSSYNINTNKIIKKLSNITYNLIYITHNDISENNKIIEKYNNYFDKIITVNNLTINKLSNKLNINIDKFICIPPCSEYIFNIKPKDKINKIIGYFGRINDIKQTKFLVECFDKIIHIFPNWKLYIVGPFSQKYNRTDIDKIIINSNNKNLLKSNIIIIDKNITNEEEKRKYYQFFDITVSTSIIEGFPFMITESLRMGTPVIISNVGGNKDCIIPEYNGDLINFKELYIDDIYNDKSYIKLINKMYEHKDYNINEFTKILSKYLNNPDKILEMSINALKTVKYKYNNIHFKNKFFEIIE